MVSRPRLPPTVYALGMVSLLTDLGSEMIVPLLPALLASLGGSLWWLGLLQGVSDCLVAGLKLLAGIWSDRGGRRKPWIVAGYGLSALLRPLFAVVAAPWQMVLVRAGDRVGKGLRSAPRDALLADTVDRAQRGAAYGVQRAMDHAGACGGGLVGFLLLAWGCDLRTVFALALVPGLLGVLVAAAFVREAMPAAPTRREPDPPGATAALRPFLWVVACAAVANSVELFLLVRAQELGVPTGQLPLLWVVLHVVRAALAGRCGAWSDRVGRRRVLLVGGVVQAAVVLLFVVAAAPWLMWPLFAMYGLHAALTEGAERGYVADRTGAGKRGATFGLYYAVQGLAALVGPVLLGGLWDLGGGEVALAAAAGAAALGVGWLVVLVPERRA